MLACAFAYVHGHLNKSRNPDNKLHWQEHHNQNVEERHKDSNDLLCILFTVISSGSDYDAQELGNADDK